YLDAYKGTRDNAIGADVARLRTILQWTSTGWKSISGPSVVINPLTTAVAVIQGLVSGSVAATATLGTVSGTTVTTGNGTLNGNWSTVQTLVKDLLAKDQDPLARIVYRNAAFRVAPNLAQPLVVENFRSGTFADTRVDDSGDLLLSAPRPAPNEPASELAYFSASGVAPDTAGTVVSDGTYLYVKTWNQYGARTPTHLVFKKIGTGFNGTVRGANYGTVGPSTAVSFGAAYWKGYIYIPVHGVGNEKKIQQLSTTTGNLVTLDIPTPIVFRNTGTLTSGDPSHLITSDGTYVYNLAYGIGDGANNGFTVQIFDPAQGFKLVRHFTMDTSSYYCDGVVCDGTYIYPMEWGAGRRMRRYRLADGVREAEWTFQQTGYVGNYQPDENNPVSGAWDPVNRVFWFGNLGNEKVHLVRGGNFIPDGTWESAVLDTGTASPYFNRLNWKGELNGNNGLSFQVRSAASPAALASATWYGPTSTTDAYTASGLSLNPVHNKQRYLQIRATLSSADLKTSPTLSQLSVEVLP
ncbi:hypothetical protein J7643_19245, partial [bacterium]|nr:hypothetical protein [bacterium]